MHRLHPLPSPIEILGREAIRGNNPTRLTCPAHLAYPAYPSHGAHDRSRRPTAEDA